MIFVFENYSEIHFLINTNPRVFKKIRYLYLDLLSPTWYHLKTVKYLMILNNNVDNIDNKQYWQ